MTAIELIELKQPKELTEEYCDDIELFKTEGYCPDYFCHNAKSYCDQECEECWIQEINEEDYKTEEERNNSRMN